MLTLERLREVLVYNPETGLLTWRIKANKRFEAGRIAGHLNKRWGYIEVRIDGQSYRGHRLAWMLMTGQPWPKEIDHINCDASDNRWSNLRAATRSQNNANRKTYAKSGFKGVVKHVDGKKWCAFISGEYLGIYETPEQAHAAYREIAKQRFGDFARFE
jgi:hypothetical protein